MLVPKVLKAVYLEDILDFLKNIYGDNFNVEREKEKLVDSMDGQIYKVYTKEMLKDNSIEIHFDIREMSREGILPKEFIVIDNIE